MDEKLVELLRLRDYLLERRAESIDRANRLAKSDDRKAASDIAASLAERLGRWIDIVGETITSNHA